MCLAGKDGLASLKGDFPSFRHGKEAKRSPTGYDDGTPPKNLLTKLQGIGGKYRAGRAWENICKKRDEAFLFWPGNYGGWYSGVGTDTFWKS